MKLFDTILSSPAVQMFGWALLHSLWQGFILAILLKGALSLSKKISANVRYLLGCITLLLMLLLPVSTALWSSSGTNSIDFVPVTESRQEVVIPAETTSARFFVSESGSSYDQWMHQAEKNLLPWLVLIWVFGVFISFFRLLGAWNRTQRLKQNESHLVLEQWLETLQKLSRQLKVSKPVILLNSSLVQVPTVIGWLKPMILIPSCALTGLTPYQLELILAHELAHIRRHDYLVNLFQTIIETFLFYHPAVWWVSSQIRNERENACDDLAVQVSGDAVVYARTLIEMERIRKTAPTLAMAADGGSLTDRIHRLIGIETSHSRHFTGFWMVVFITVFIVTVGVTKRNSSVIKERVEDALSSNLASITNSELIEGIIKVAKTQIAEENPKSKKLIEESEKSLVSLPSETVSNVKPDAKPDTNIEQKTVPSIAPTTPQPIEIPPVPAPAMMPLSPFAASDEVILQNDLNDRHQIKIKFKPENNAEAEDQLQDFIEEMASVGYTNLSVKELINLKSVGVTANYIKSLRALGFNELSIKEIISLRALNITPAYIEEIRTAGYKELDVRELTNFKAVGVTAGLINTYRSAGYADLSARNLSQFSVHHITTDYINTMNAIGFGKLLPKDLIELRVFGITTEFVRTARNRLGNDLTLRQIISLKNMGILEEKDKQKD